MAGRPQRKEFAERRRLALKDFREQALEQESQLASIQLVGDDEEEFEVPHPMLLSDDAQKRVEAVQNFEDLDRDGEGVIKNPPEVDGKKADPYIIRLARALLGDEEHARFVKAGGHSNDITLAWKMLSRDFKEVAELDPK